MCAWRRGVALGGGASRFFFVRRGRKRLLCRGESTHWYDARTPASVIVSLRPFLSLSPRPRSFRVAASLLRAAPRSHTGSYCEGGIMDHALTELAFTRLRLARDLILSTHVQLKDQGMAD